MRCVACGAEAPDTAEQCPDCREPLGPWRQLNDTAAQLLYDGVRDAAAGRDLRAALSLSRASFLNPGDPVTLKVFGQFLARHGLRDQALWHLKAAAAKAPGDAEAAAALRRVEALPGAPKPPPPPPPPKGG